jgi:hypothetical protein
MQQWSQPISLSDCHPEPSRPSGVAKDLHLNAVERQTNHPSRTKYS